MLAYRYARSIDQTRCDYGEYYMTAIREPVEPEYLRLVRPLKRAHRAAWALATVGAVLFALVIVLVQTDGFV